MIEVSLSLIEQNVTKISPKIRLHWNMRRTVVTRTLPGSKLCITLIISHIMMELATEILNLSDQDWNEKFPE